MKRDETPLKMLFKINSPEIAVSLKFLETWVLFSKVYIYTHLSHFINKTTQKTLATSVRLNIFFSPPLPLAYPCEICSYLNTDKNVFLRFKV